MARRLLYALLLLAATSVSASAQFTTNCTQWGGLPWVNGGCLNAQDLNRAFGMSASALPPANNFGTGLPKFAFWMDTSTSPPTIRQCLVTNCSSTYTASQWAVWGTVNTSSGVITLSSTVVVSLTVPVRLVSTGTTDTATTADGLIKWTSASTSSKSQTMPICDSSTAKVPITIKDGVGNANTYNIIVDSNGGSTIDGAASYAITINRGSITLLCDGVSDWTIQ